MGDMEASALLYTAAGAAALLAALLPRLLGRLPASMPMVFLGLGVLAFLLIGDLPSPDPLQHRAATERITEVCVLVALFGAGLALDRPAGWQRWNSTWLLLAVTMPLTIVAMALLGFSLLGLGVAGAVLLAAALAPTDPVLASDVQVGEPTDVDEGEEADVEDEPRFALTSEAGLNDALAFPFVYAAIAMAQHGTAPGGWLGRWLLVDVGWRCVAGAAVGFGVGRLLGGLFFRNRRSGGRLAEEAEGFVALACTFLAYGAAELVAGYGFVAVFVCACTIRAAERAHGYHTVLHGFIDQVERLLTAGILLLLGGAIARGLLDPLRPVDVAAALLLLLVVRPVAGWVALQGGGRGHRDRAVIAFFGVRGIGSIYYLAYALGHARFAEAGRLWAVIGLVVTLSVVLHGMSATPVMRAVDKRRERKAAAHGKNPRSREVPV
jgi:NhaP-type Na+/H+ or K+/H+ antiporter